MDDLVSTAEAAAILGVTPRAIRLYHTKHGLPGRIVADRLLFLRRDVQAFVKPKMGRPKKKTRKKR